MVVDLWMFQMLKMWMLVPGGAQGFSKEVQKCHHCFLGIVFTSDLQSARRTD